MERRPLGQGGPMAGAVALGTMNFMGTYGAADPRESLAVIEACIEMGIDHIDTSDVYGAGGAETLLAPVLARHKGRVTIASKAGITRNPDHPFDNSPAYLRAALEGSLRRMGVERIDLYYLHRREPARPVEEAMETLLRLRDEGKIGAIGLSEVAPATLERACAVGPVAAIQSEYSLWSRQVELGMTQACARHGAALVAFSPLGRGAFGDRLPEPAAFAPGDLRAGMPRFQPANWARNRPRLQAFAAFARDLGESPAAVALAWVLSRAPHVIALPGSRSLAHWHQIARGAALRLDAETLRRIDALLPAGWAHGPRYGAAMALGPEAWS